MGVWEALKLYPKATAWSALASTVLVMEGYDLVVINSFYALESAWTTIKFMVLLCCRPCIVTTSLLGQDWHPVQLHSPRSTA